MEALTDLINEQRDKQSNERAKVFLSTVARKPLKIQIEQYNDVISKDRDELLAKYEKHNVDNSKLKQLFEMQRLEETIKVEIQMREASKSYTGITLEKISLTKQCQYRERFIKLEGVNSNNNFEHIGKSYIAPYKKTNTWLYTAAEWVMEDWSSRNRLKYSDYNEINQRAPRDCKIANIDIDVKTTTEIGSRAIKIFSRHNRDVTSQEVVIGLASSIEDYNSKSSDHYIYGVFDPKTFDLINAPLGYLKPNNNAITACSFQDLEEYFKLTPYKQPELGLLDDEVVEYLIESNTCFRAVFRSLRNSPEKLNNFLQQTVDPAHHDFIPVVLELVEKQLISLLPHYLADYLIGRIMNKKAIDVASVSNVFYKIYQPNADQRTYIDSLIRIQEVIPKVRCRWHGDESMEEMQMSCYLGSFIPTFVAHCSHDNLNKTTFYTYNWQNGIEIAYGDNNTNSCDSPDCGCLTVEHTGTKVGRRSCIKYGEKALYEVESGRLYDQLKWEFFG